MAPGQGQGGSGSRSFLSRLSSVAAESRADADDEEMEAEEEQGPKSKIFTEDDLSPGPEEDALDDVRRLGRALARERGTPALLEWDSELVGALLDKLEQQVGPVL